MCGHAMKEKAKASLAGGLVGVVLVLVFSAATIVQVKTKRTLNPTAIPTPAPTPTPLKIDEKKFEGLYRAGKALELAGFAKSQQELKVELAVATDHVSNSLEESLVAAYKEVDQRADRLASRLKCENSFRELDAEHERQIASAQKLGRDALRSLDNLYDQTKEKLQKICGPAVMAITVDDLTSSLRVAEGIYLGKPLPPAPTPGGKAMDGVKP
jgi:hypothetical protein